MSETCGQCCATILGTNDTRTHIHIHTHTYIHTSHTFTYILIVYIHTFTYIHIHTHIHIHSHTYTYIHTFTFTYIHIHTYTYTHTQYIRDMRLVLCHNSRKMCVSDSDSDSVFKLFRSHSFNNCPIIGVIITKGISQAPCVKPKSSKWCSPLLT